jgi:hypothetical protein
MSQVPWAFGFSKKLDIARQSRIYDRESIKQLDGKREWWKGRVDEWSSEVAAWGVNFVGNESNQY